MRAAEFARKRAQIIQRLKYEKQRKRALTRLVHEANASLVVAGGKVAGYQLPGGEIVCIKRRYKTKPQAELELQLMHACNNDKHRVPVRAYPCEYCKGWHLTSQPRNSF